MMTFVVFGLCYVALSLLSATMSRHQDQLLAAEPAPHLARGLRYGGWLLLAVALAPALRAWGISVGIAAWLGLLTFACLALALQLTYLPRSVWRVSLALAGFMPLAWLLSRPM
jgi:hypothetical protein